MANILFLEPFYGGSHKYFADGLIKHSKHKFTLLSLPGRFWKWRMESASLTFYQKIQSKGLNKPDLVLASNLMDLCQFKGLTGWNDIPHLLYVHENQLDYPLSPGEIRDFHYVWKDYMNFQTADSLVFNSHYNLESFLNKFKGFNSRLPDCKPRDPSEFFRSKTKIISPGCSLINYEPQNSAKTKMDGTPVILWNQRWEHDKNPEAFFAFLKELQSRSIQFKLILLGESYKNSPSCFTEAKEQFKQELIQYGYSENREDYENWLKKSDFVLSTAIQENFGISIVEAMSAGAIPLLPNRLAYPEVLPLEFHSKCLYSDPRDMMKKFIALLHLQTNGDAKEKTITSQELRMKVSREMTRYSWAEICKKFDLYIDSYLDLSIKGTGAGKIR